MSSENNEDEEWRPIPGCEGRYEASSMGRIRSLPRIVITGKGSRSKVKGGILKPNTSTPYNRIHLNRGCGRRDYPVHLLVLETFRGPKPEGKQGAHDNGIRTDNRLANLMYKTPAENVADKIRHGTTSRGELNPRAKLKVEQVMEIRAAALATVTQRQLAAKYDVSIRLVQKIRAREIWRHV